MKIRYYPDHAIKAGLLVIGVLLGLIFGFSTHKAIWFLILPLLSQYHLSISVIEGILFPSEMEALHRLVTSAHLTDRADNHTLTWYRASAVLTLDMRDGYNLLKIDANGISNTTNINQLAMQVGAAFHHSAYLTDTGNGYAIYRIDLNHKHQRINNYDF
ncbi:hypothetical protein [Companilactobacillus nuruki]|uniref:Uncharacterized protein n=1 Tax=Companilactobacillus nuruki TaxID=1993540 RepID=A0A2N7AWE2_9LACO|nr:hypothetical protein [Companilactobacillus nuruki]PMD73046.1 hypothetical protein CBP76_02625 [Companilactobacillus nuruki]